MNKGPISTIFLILIHYSFIVNIFTFQMTQYLLNKKTFLKFLKFSKVLFLRPVIYDYGSRHIFQTVSHRNQFFFQMTFIQSFRIINLSYQLGHSYELCWFWHGSNNDNDNHYNYNNKPKFLPFRVFSGLVLLQINIFIFNTLIKTSCSFPIPYNLSPKTIRISWETKLTGISLVIN